MKLYHISPAINRDSILKNGLICQLGNRSAYFGQTRKAIYVCKTRTALKRMGNHLLFLAHPDFDEGVDVWAIDGISPETYEDDKYKGVGYYITQNIPPEHLTQKNKPRKHTGQSAFGTSKFVKRLRSLWGDGNEKP